MRHVTMKKILLLAVTSLIFIGLAIIVLEIKRINYTQQLIAHYPQVPVYQNASLQSSTCNDVQSMLFRADWVSSDTVPQVMGWYTTELQKAGWNLDIPPANQNSSDIQYAEFTKGLYNSWLSRLQLSVQSDKNTHKTKIEISFPAPDSEHEEGEG
jgi:hypothetical protein